MSLSFRTRVAFKLAQPIARQFPAAAARRLRNPVFMVGCGRSGTTMLAGLLANHPDIAVYPTEAAELWHPRAYPWHRATIDVPPIWVDPQTFTARSLASRQDPSEDYLRAIFGAYQRLAGGDRCFLNKCVWVTFMIDFLLEKFPDARFLHLVRDGRAVALSYAEKVKPKLDTYAEAYHRGGHHASFEELLESFAGYWKEHIMELERQKERLGLERRGLLLEMRYEEFCDAPDEHLQRIAQFIDVRLEGFQATSLTAISSTNHKWQKKLGGDLLARLERIMEPVLSAKGYPLLGSVHG